MAAERITRIIKRNGEMVAFDQEKIVQAIFKATQAVGKTDRDLAAKLAQQVVARLQEHYACQDKVPRVEDIQDMVEEVLIRQGVPEVAKAYIIYRHERTKRRLQAQNEIDFSKPLMVNRIKTIIKRTGEVVPFDQEKITVAIYKAAGALGIHNRPLAQQLSNEVVWILNQTCSPDNPPSVEDIQDVVERVLIKNKQTEMAKAYIIYRHERAKARAGRKESKGMGDPVPYKKIWHILSWNIDHHCATVPDLNQEIRAGRLPQLVAAADQAYEEDVAQAAEAIVNSPQRIRLVIIAGPSSSGKTTTTIKLSQRLKEHGLDLVALNIDNYFYDLELHPKDEFGDYDFETPEALDLPLIKKHLAALIAGQPAAIPRYNFKTGRRAAEYDTLRIEEHQVILIDTLHGLYEEMTSTVPPELKFKLYIETLSALKDVHGKFVRWTDIRLLRRMVRDRTQRAYDPKRTIEHWHYVRRSEMKHIIPYIPTVDYIINGALAYELPVLKKYLFEYFPGFVAAYEHDPKHQDAYMRAKRLLELLSTLETVEDDSCIPPEALLREFIGGSCYTY